MSKRPEARGVAIGITILDDKSLPRNVTQLTHPGHECGNSADLVRGRNQRKHSDARLLPGRADRHRPRSRRAAEQRDDIPAGAHSITSSARASKVTGTLMPSAFAVIRLTMRSNLVGCSTGMLAGFTPRRILST